MGVRTGLGFIASAALIAFGLGAAPAASADAGATLLVDGSASTCSDQGAGTAAQPFCTVQPAVDAAQAGQTVVIAKGRYAGFTVHNSGAPGAPITVEGQGDGAYSLAVDIAGSTSSPALTLHGVHDVQIHLLQFVSGGDTGTVDLAGAQNVTLDQVQADIDSAGAGPGAGAALRVGTGSSSIALTRSTFEAAFGAGTGLTVDAGVSGVQVASDEIVGSDHPAVSVSGASDVDLAGNDFSNWNAPALAVDDGATGVSVENNTMYADMRNGAVTPVVTVSSDSVAGVHEDYNALDMIPKTDPEYRWGGTTYATSQAFTATGQGAHEIDQVQVGSLNEGSPLIDSGDAQAPGELSTDIYGSPRVRDPLVQATGSVGGFVDRGPVEFQDPIKDAVITPRSGVAPVTTTVSPGPETAWQKPLRESVDFGDGSSSGELAAGVSVQHVYPTPGKYSVTVVTTDSDGSTHTSHESVVAGTATAPQASLVATADVFNGSDGKGEVRRGTFQFSTPSTTDPWEIGAVSMDFGDGISGPYASVTHNYAKTGVYHPKLTITDLLGRTSTATTTVVVGDEAVQLWQADAMPALARTVPAHGVIRVNASALEPNRIAAGPQVGAVVLNTTVLKPSTAGYLTVYPDGASRPTAPTVSFAAGQTASNQVTAAVGGTGYVDFYNGGSTPVFLTVDSYATENENWIAGAFQPLAPTQILGTAGVGTLVGGGRTALVHVTGKAGVPAGAQSALLAVTVSGGRSSGSLTAYDDGEAMPSTPELDWAAGQTVENLVMVPLTDGKADLRNISAGSALVRADVIGNYAVDTASTVELPFAPVVVLDTLHGIGAPARQLAAHQTLRIKVTGIAGLPTSGAAAATMNLTALGSTGPGYLSVFPDGGGLASGAPAVHWAGGQTISGAWVSRIGANGYVDIYNGGSRPVSVQTTLSGLDYLYSAPAS